MPIYETINDRGLRLDATKVTVTASRTSLKGGLPVGRDIICLLGFFNSEHSLYSIIPVSSIDQVIGDVVEDMTDYSSIKAFKSSKIYRALVSCKLNGGTDIVLCKIGDLDEIVDLSEDDFMQLTYDRIDTAIPLACDNEWFAYIIPVDAPAEGYEKRGSPYAVFTVEAGHPLLPGDVLYQDTPVELVTTLYDLKMNDICAYYDAAALTLYIKVPDESLISFSDTMYPEIFSADPTNLPVFLDFMAMTSSHMASAMQDGLFLQAMLSTSSSNGTIWMNSESMREKERWQVKYCYSDSLGWIPTNDMYQFVAVPTGRALFASAEYDAFFEAGLAPAVAGLASSLGDDVSLAGRTLYVTELISPVLGSTADLLSVSGYMPVGQTAMMRRRKTEGAVLLGDNTMAVPGSDFKQEVVMRLARRISLKLRVSLQSVIGTNGLTIGTIVEKTMDNMVKVGTIRGYNYKISKDPDDHSKLRLFVNVHPFLPVKAIQISIVTGPFVQ